jgi:hypothetical protein
MVALVTELGDPNDTGLESDAMNRVARAGIVELPERWFVNQRDDGLLGARTSGSRRNENQSRRYHGRGQEICWSPHGGTAFRRLSDRVSPLLPASGMCAHGIN